jgi:hypothetical protein
MGYLIASLLYSENPIASYLMDTKTSNWTLISFSNACVHDHYLTDLTISDNVV